MQNKREAYWGLGLGFFVAILYSVFTNHIWEDFFITFRHSQNLVEGHGLLYNAGERVHGFTSPLGVLVPALLYWVSGAKSYIAALWLFRILGALLFGWTAMLAWQMLRNKSASAFAGMVFLSFFLFDVKAVAYSVNGMETGFMLFFLALAVSRLSQIREGDWKTLGIAASGLMWTRPDSFIYIAILLLSAILFRWFEVKPHFATLVKGALCAAVLYLPWILVAWWYYGTPIPNTVLAKGGGLHPHLLPTAFPMTLAQWTQVPFFKTAATPFLPIYFFLGGWPWWTEYWAELLGALTAFYWLLPVADRMGRASSFAFLLSVVYLSCIPPFPWYLVPAAFFGWIAVASAAAKAWSYTRKVQPWAFALPATALAAFVLLNAGFGLSNAYTMRIQQQEVEFGNRKQIGLWLKENVKPTESIMLEPLGYVGYFSEAHMTDFPGLVSPAIVRLRESQPGMTYRQVIEATTPKWLVLRPGETSAFVEAHYDRAATFDIRNRLEMYRALPGRGYLDFDSVFTVYRLRDGAPTQG